MEFHTIEPVCGPDAEILILGSFPSVKSREEGFFYAHPQNRFWRVLAWVLDEPLPQNADEKRAMLLRRKIAIWDVIACCDIEGSGDSSIKNVHPSDIAALLDRAPIRRVFTNGGAAHRLYRRHCASVTGIADTPLPSTSPANAACSFEMLAEAWRVIAEI